MESSASSGQPGSAADVTLEGREWRLSDHLGADGRLVPVAEEVIATATFIEGRVAGTTGCNRYGGTYRIDGPSLSFGPLAMTRMACLPPRDAVERAITAALESTAGCAVIGDVLELTDAEGNTVLRFRAAAAPGLVGTRWVATDDALAGSLLDELADVSLGADDREAVADELARADDLRKTLA